MESLAAFAYAAFPPDFNSAPQEVVFRVHQAYRAGRLIPRETSTETNRREFLASMEHLAASRLSRRELLFVSRCKGYCDEARHAADHNEITVACRSISAAQMFADSLQISPEARLLCRSEIVPAEAYLDELWGDLHSAWEKVLESARIDQELEEHYSYHGTHAHRLHLLNRLVRLEAAISGLLPAMKLARVVLQYQSGKRCQMPFPGAWGHEYTRHLPPGLLRFFTVQLVMEIAGIVAEAHPTQLRPAIEMILDSDALEQGEVFWTSYVRRWMELKVLATGNPTPYLTHCADYLAWPALRVAALWDTTALDAALTCKSLQPEQSVPFIQEVLRDLGNAHYFPRPLRRIVARMQAELGWAPAPVRCRAAENKVFVVDRNKEKANE